MEVSRSALFQIITIAGMADSGAFNCPRLQRVSEDAFEYSKALIEARKAVIRLYNFVKTRIPGFENSYITNIAPKTGRREISRVKCLYDYTIEDIINEKDFEHPALKSN